MKVCVEFEASGKFKNPCENMFYLKTEKEISGIKRIKTSPSNFKIVINPKPMKKIVFINLYCSPLPGRLNPYTLTDAKHHRLHHLEL